MNGHSSFGHMGGMPRFGLQMPTTMAPPLHTSAINHDQSTPPNSTNSDVIRPSPPQHWLEAAAANMALRQNVLAAATLPQLFAAAAMAPNSLASSGVTGGMMANLHAALQAAAAGGRLPHSSLYGAGFFGNGAAGLNLQPQRQNTELRPPQFLPMESAFVAARYRYPIPNSPVTPTDMMAMNRQQLGSVGGMHGTNASGNRNDRNSHRRPSSPSVPFNSSSGHGNLNRGLAFHEHFMKHMSKSAAHVPPLIPIAKPHANIGGHKMNTTAHQSTRKPSGHIRSPTMTNGKKSLSNAAAFSAIKKCPTTYQTHFTRGTLVQLANGDLKRVEELKGDDFVNSADLTSNLKVDCSELIKVEPINCDSSILRLTFAVGDRQLKVSVQSAQEHPFFVVGQGWCSYNPQRTLKLYGLNCGHLKLNHRCISLTYRETVQSKGKTHSKNVNSEIDDVSKNNTPTSLARKFCLIHNGNGSSSELKRIASPDDQRLTRIKRQRVASDCEESVANSINAVAPTLIGAKRRKSTLFNRPINKLPMFTVSNQNDNDVQVQPNRRCSSTPPPVNGLHCVAGISGYIRKRRASF